ncbi:MAG: GAF domain-containing protein [Synergistaceae bacterium]|jgi:HD-GYP domain-containing protein (c-di-GMP phosphodiesterase class II)|nr:GAF domain-containing protein [Synergistaceae bacterium]
MPLPSVETLLDIGVALSKEKDIDRLLETILDAAMDIANCDGGTLYVLEGGALHFRILVTKSLGLRRGVRGVSPELPPVPLSRANVSSRAALDKTLINVADVYASDDFDFSGTRRYDGMTGYKTVSMLNVPMEDDNCDVIGVLQLINALSGEGAVVPFAREYEPVIFSLASQAAICLTNRAHAAETMELLDSFVRVMSEAIDARSPYNANHTRNMARYADNFADWLNGDGGIAFDGERRRRFLMSVWLHDIGKLVVPLEVMDKANRLGPKINDVMSRFRIFALQNEIGYLRQSIGGGEYARRAAEIEAARELVEQSDRAGFLPDETLAAIRELGEKTGPDGETPFLMDEELTCLSVRKGTLTDGERRVMESHVVMTRRLLSGMSFPKRFRSVPDWASSHHEYLNGEGYPDKLSGDAIPTETRILTVLDVFDALTAGDRPYKPAMPAEKALGILTDMAGDGRLDPDIVDRFIRSGAWKRP